MLTTLMKNYKYRSGAAALRCLSEGTAYFASPAQLNDSLEAKFDLENPSEFIKTVGSSLNEIALEKGLQVNYQFDSTESKERDLVITRENNRFFEATQRVGIFSTATRPDNQPMWAYYCDNSNGVCFELEWPDEILEKFRLRQSNVLYTRESRVHDRAEDLRQLLFELAEAHPEWDIPQLQDFSLSEKFRREFGIRSTVRAASIKHADWEHESEIRILSPHYGPLPIMKDILKRVFFVRTDFPEWGEIVTQLYENYPQVELAMISFEHKDPFVKIQPMEFRRSVA